MCQSSQRLKNGDVSPNSASGTTISGLGQSLNGPFDDGKVYYFGEGWMKYLYLDSRLPITEESLP